MMLGEYRAWRLPGAACVRGVELVPFGRIWAVVCEQFEKGCELLIGRALGPDWDREVRWAGHELAVHLGGVP
ncbi:MAG: hypothetical protein HOL13_10260 [Phycisphaerae bacterium]|jgi:hypothetical protein|nr:hypothetical protein [Phycisphaerae bacterium]